MVVGGCDGEFGGGGCLVYADDDEVEGDSDGDYHLVVLKIVRNEGKDEKDGGVMEGKGGAGLTTSETP